MHAYSQYEEQQRQQEQREGSSFFGQSASSYSRKFSRSDPLGYYEALGVEPGASKQEIQVLPQLFLSIRLMCMQESHLS